jgi:L,D-peptidoglycan transpeptidase YkuD (ErfK/YbiS/YcfS/YnhG family)|tara:strand:- start:308 stop:733 length:426 start_codon:yes stop_codon:yes gene_type:complete
VGKNGLNSHKKEGDYSTPKGLFKLKKLFFRKDRVDSLNCKIKRTIITKNMGWCDDSSKKKYNQLTYIFNKKNKENFYRTDYKYDYLITISHNDKNIPFKGSAIFIHLTKDYQPTAGCIALKKKDFQIMLRLIDQKSKIQIG